jgi:hypothetical protein
VIGGSTNVTGDLCAPGKFFEAKLEGDCIAGQGHVDGLPQQCLGFTVKHGFGR